MNKSDKRKIIISWILVFLCAGVIFYLSSRTAAESTIQSQTMIGSFSSFFLGTVIEDEELLSNIDGIVRESAHGVEYMIFSILVLYAVFNTISAKIKELPVEAVLKKSALYSIALSFLYAISDEIHQIPIAGRAFEIKDLLIDLLGIIVGVIIAQLALGYLRNPRKKV